STTRSMATIPGGSDLAPVAPWKDRRGHLGWQAAISTGFFLAAAFCARAVIGAYAHDPGVDLDRLAAGTLDLRFSNWPEARGRQLIADLDAMSRADPRIDSFAIASGLPFGTGLTPLADVAVDDLGASANRDRSVTAIAISATDGFFVTTGMRVVRGRAFDTRD